MLILGIIYSLSMYKKDEKTSFKQKKSIYSRQKIEITQNLLCNFVTNKKPTFYIEKIEYKTINLIVSIVYHDA